MADDVTLLIGKLDEISKKTDRMQDQISEMSKTLGMLARVDERLANQKEGMQRLGRVVDEQWKEIDSLRKEVSNLKILGAEQKQKVFTIDRITWAIIVLILGSIDFFKRG